ncbi:ABC transporter substrate-binding protein [Streptomyces marincola]|uniref:Amino acid ABC transporter substrate-binding protein n=1 Tax=Streptomyces marincola TaxID=2878388 RepID=A0A1W7CXC8_9ACTN|nr:ABC transporter substrate-binding protein [Streptomyces marincola]ARQ69432.1 amino acid ABC transporter substrate-binding protein [Streptomyces marincola]
MTATPARRRRALLTASAATALALSLTACGGGDTLEEEGGDGGTEESAGSLTVGGANFTEATIMTELYAQVLEEAGYSTTITTTEGRELYAPELESGAIDVVPEYAATMTEYYNAQENGPGAEPVASSDVDATVAALRELAEPRGLTVLDAGEAVDQNAFAVSEEYAAEHGLETLTDLGEAGLPVRVAAGEDCPSRPFCQPGLEETYGIDITAVDPLGVGTVQAKQAVQNGDDQLVLVTTTDATLEDFGLVILEDDRNLQLADNLLPVLNTETASDENIAAALDELTSVLTTDDLIELNRQVDAERRKADEVARDYLVERGLVGS